MPTATHLKINKKEKILILFLFAAIILIFLYVKYLNFDCIWKRLFNISCPSCGMSRALKLILKGKIIESFSYNILAFPIIVILITLAIVSIIDIIFKKQYLYTIYKFILNHYVIFIIMPIMISWVINIIRKI